MWCGGASTGCIYSGVGQISMLIRYSEHSPEEGGIEESRRINKSRNNNVSRVGTIMFLE